MDFEWHEAKRLQNLALHGVDFEDAALIFASPILEAEDRRETYGERRFRALGEVGGEFFLVATRGAGRPGGSSVRGEWMMTDDVDTRRYSLDELAVRRAALGSRTRVDAPARAVDAAFWREARVVMPAAGKTSVHLRVDSDVLDWFRGQGKGHLSRMNAVLRSFMEAHRG